MLQLLILSLALAQPSSSGLPVRSISTAGLVFIVALTLAQPVLHAAGVPVRTGANGAAAASISPVGEYSYSFDGGTSWDETTRVMWFGWAPDEGVWQAWSSVWAVTSNLCSTNSSPVSEWDTTTERYYYRCNSGLANGGASRGLMSGSGIFWASPFANQDMRANLKMPGYSIDGGSYMDHGRVWIGWMSAPVNVYQNLCVAGGDRPDTCSTVRYCALRFSPNTGGDTTWQLCSSGSNNNQSCTAGISAPTPNQLVNVRVRATAALCRADLQVWGSTTVETITTTTNLPGASAVTVPTAGCINLDAGILGGLGINFLSAGRNP